MHPKHILREHRWHATERPLTSENGMEQRPQKESCEGLTGIVGCEDDVIGTDVNFLFLHRCGNRGRRKAVCAVAGSRRVRKRVWLIRDAPGAHAAPAARASNHVPIIQCEKAPTEVTSRIAYRGRFRFECPRCKRRRRRRLRVRHEFKCEK